MRARAAALACALSALVACTPTPAEEDDPAAASPTPAASPSLVESPSPAASSSPASPARVDFVVQTRDPLGSEPFDCRFVAVREREWLRVSCVHTAGTVQTNSFELWLGEGEGRREARSFLHPRWGTGQVRGGAAFEWSFERYDPREPLFVRTDGRTQRVPLPWQ
ncbi:MAG: hypothetical protein AB7N76_32105 [Planctomycetota bacterium]